MKKLYETFTDEEHAKLKLAKGTDTWHDFIMKLAVVDDVRILLKNAPNPKNMYSDDFEEDYSNWLSNIKEVLDVE